MDKQWQAHAVFSPAGEMLFGLEAGSEQEASEAAQIRVTHVGLPLDQLELVQLDPAADRGR